MTQLQTYYVVTWLNDEDLIGWKIVPYKTVEEITRFFSFEETEFIKFYKDDDNTDIANFLEFCESKNASLLHYAVQLVDTNPHYLFPYLNLDDGSTVLPFNRAKNSELDHA